MDASRATMARMRMTNIESARCRRISPDRAGKDEPSAQRKNHRPAEPKPCRCRREPSEQGLGGVGGHEGDGDDEGEKEAYRALENAHRPAAEIEKGAHQVG